MDSKIWSVIIGLTAGSFGYWFTTFHMQPILRYRDLRNQVLRDFIYYAQVIKTDHLNDDMKALGKERRLANRKISAELSAAILDLPCWYLRLIRSRGQKPENAATHLIGYSNTSNYEDAEKKENAIRRYLGLPKS